MAANYPSLPCESCVETSPRPGPIPAHDHFGAISSSISGYTTIIRSVLADDHHSHYALGKVFAANMKVCTTFGNASVASDTN